VKSHPPRLTTNSTLFETTSAPLIKLNTLPITLQDPTPEIGEWFGYNVLMSDLNGDGHADATVVTALDKNSNNPIVFVYFGPTYSSSAVINYPESDFSFQLFGRVLAAGDLNNDGINDLIVSNIRSIVNTLTAGKVFVFLGGRPFDTTSDFTLNDPLPEDSEQFGASMVTGDINGDGIDDLVVGADVDDAGSSRYNGQAFVFLGGKPFNSTADFILHDPAPEPLAAFGKAMTIGDVNGDRKKDIIIAAPNSEVGSVENAGQAFVFLGGSSFDINADFTLQDPNPKRSEAFGSSIASGDLNGDHIDDIAIMSGSQSSASKYPEVRIYFGGSPFDTLSDATLINPIPKNYSLSFACGDINQDNFSDIIMGVDNAIVNGYDWAGKVFVFWGSSSFDTNVDGTLLDPNPETDARFGLAISIANPQGDLLVGAFSSAVFAPGQRTFYGRYQAGIAVKFTISLNGAIIEPFSIDFNGRSSSGSSANWTKNYPVLPIVNNRVSYRTASDVFEGTFTTPDLLEGTVSSRFFIIDRTYETGLLKFYSKRGGDAGEAFVFSAPVATAIALENGALSNLPADFELQQNYPNPFNPSTTIEFSLPRSSDVTLKVFDLLGKEIATLVDKKLAVGRHKVRWDAGEVENGIYFYRLQAGSFVKTKKLIVLK